jgi:UrcA family protein
MNPPLLSQRPAYLYQSLARSLCRSIVAALVCASANAGGPAAHPPASINAKVSLQDLDLNTPEGVRAAKQRIAVTAGRLCRTFSDSTRSTDAATVADCYRESFDAAIHELDAQLQRAASGREATHNIVATNIHGDPQRTATAQGYALKTATSTGVGSASDETALSACTQRFATTLANEGVATQNYRVELVNPPSGSATAPEISEYTYELLARDPSSAAAIARASCTVDRDLTVTALRVQP